MSAYTHADSVLRQFLTRTDVKNTLAKGALLALSGGKDSVLLLSLFSRYAKEAGISLVAYHLHHGIRGTEADRDAAFCEEICRRFDTPLVVEHADVPALAKERGEGVEEAARRTRYTAFLRVCKERGLSAVLTAHTASDLAETVLLYLLRGGGTRALCGIPPVRSLGDGVSVIRPLLALTAEEVMAALEEAGIPYVTDSTNSDTAFRRNYVRRELLPRMQMLSPSPERAIARLAENMRADEEYLEDVAKNVYEAQKDGASLHADAFFALPEAIRYRVFRRFYVTFLPDAPLPERVHVDTLMARLSQSGDFTLHFPGGVSVRRERGRLLLSEQTPFDHGHTPIHLGCNRLADGGFLWFLEKTSPPLPEIIYTLSTQRSLTSATIEGELYVRSRRKGDAYRFGGITHKLKKLFSDRKIPISERPHLPVLCDSRGILWVPSFGVRDESEKDEKTLTLLYLPARKVTSEILSLIEER